LHTTTSHTNNNYTFMDSVDGYFRNIFLRPGKEFLIDTAQINHTPTCV